MVRFACSFCGKLLQVDDSQAGKKCACPQCKSVNQVPGKKAEIQAANVRRSHPEQNVQVLLPTVPPNHGDDDRDREFEGSVHSGSDFLPPGYELLGELGRGGMGVVYQAHQVRLKRTVAVKMILAGAHASKAELARFNSEAQAVARLQHPNIVQVFEVGEHKGLPFFTLEYCSGGSLATNLRGRRIKPRTAALIVEKLARAMHVAHGRNIIHRDLKPANILLALPDDSEGRLSETELFAQPKITDFGLAKSLDHDHSRYTQSGAVMGTANYMSPEQAAGKKDIGPATDIYALGAILYELLAGVPPFSGATSLNVIMQVVEHEPPPPSQLRAWVPPDLDAICMKCLQKDPRKRYETAEDLAEDLRRYKRDEPIVARPIGTLERRLRWCRRNAVVTALAVVLTLSWVIGLNFIWAMSTELHLARQHVEQAKEIERRARDGVELARRQVMEMRLVMDRLTKAQPANFQPQQKAAN